MKNVNLAPFRWYQLSHMQEISPGKLWEIVLREEDPERLFAENVAATLDLLTLREQGIFQKYSKKCEEELAWDRYKRWFLPYGSENYPEKLYELEDAPFGLFYRGTPKKTGPGVAIIGARNATVIGKELAYQISGELATYGVTVISGMAMGIDGAAHKGCLSHNGYSIGFIGTGIDIAYPSENLSLYEHMDVRGCIYSEFPPGTKGHSYNFPRRNRLISAASDYVLVVEARRKSGSLITVDYALEQGISVGAIPGRPCDTLSEGCNQLIRQGADLCLSAEDILDRIQLTSGREEVPFQVAPELMLSSMEKRLYEYLNPEPRFVDQILCDIGASMEETLVALSELECKGLIKQNPHLHYYRL